MKVVVSEFVSLDGVMEDPGGAEGFEHGGWSFKFKRGPEGDRFKVDELSAAGALLLGRVTYEGFAKAWPSIKDEEGFADRMNGIRKYVVSNTLKDSEATWNNTTIVRGDLAAEVAKLKARSGGDLLVFGSARLAQGLAEHGLVDDYRLMVYPVILGGGKRLFADEGKMASLELVDSKAAGDGIVMLTYKAA
ncbi:MAG TPA: dihydrofolate reductase family protein [Dehalococcoidia bacterium]|jgi:dihydrofolate reductase|nr:dihydrofolate reductase family protein [Dehalococcoidia bacterium]